MNTWVDGWVNIWFGGWVKNWLRGWVSEGLKACLGTCENGWQWGKTGEGPLDRMVVGAGVVVVGYIEGKADMVGEDW